MKKLFMVLLILFSIVGILSCGGSGNGGTGTQGPPASYNGLWSGTYTYAGGPGCNCGTGNWTANVSENSGVLSGSGSVTDQCIGTVNGTVTGTYNASTGVVEQALGLASGGSVIFNGMVSNNTVIGSWVSSYGCQGTFEGSEQ